MPGMTATSMRPKTELVARWRVLAGDYVAALEVSRDGQLCVAGLGDGCVLALDVATGRERFRSHAHDGGVLGVSISPDGTRIASCGQAPDAKLFDDAGALLGTLPGGSSAWCEHVAWAPTGGRVATAAGRTVRVWTSRGEPLLESERLPSTVTGLAWHPDGGELAASCYGGVHVLPVADGASARHLAWKGSLVSVTWSPDRKVITGGCQDCSVHFCRRTTGHDAQMSGYPFKPKALAWDRDATLLATSGDPIVTVWDFRGKGPEGTRPIQLASHKGLCTTLAFSPKKGVLASGSQDTSVLLWEPRRGPKPVRFAFLEDEITALAWHPQHKGLLGADASGTVCCWEVG